MARRRCHGGHGFRPRPGAGADLGEGGGEAGVVGRVDGSEIAHDGAGLHPGDDPARPEGRQGGVGVGDLEGHADRGDRQAGEGAAAGDGLGVDHLGAGHLRGQPLRPFPQHGGGRGRHAPQGDGVAVAGQVGQGHGLQRGQGHLVGPDRSGQGVPPDGGHQVGPTGDHPRLGPAEQLVA